jgi:hypothetical protein
LPLNFELWSGSAAVENSPLGTELGLVPLEDSSGNRRRIRDQRVRQFWDKKHLVASALNEIAKRKPSQPEPGCCVQEGFYWDDAILYAPHERWKDGPTSVFWNGPVF